MLQKETPIKRLKLDNVKKLNVGCGERIIKGWLNVGLFNHEEHPYGKIKIKDGAEVLNFDMTKELPIRKGSIEYIYSSHFIEHITFRQGMKFLERCFYYLKEGGIIRITFPDLELWVKNYYENNHIFFKKYKSIFRGGAESILETKGEIFMSQIHNQNHKWNYDFESMKHILEKAGFSQIEKKRAFESCIQDIYDIEPGWMGRLMETCYVEAKKMTFNNRRKGINQKIKILISSFNR